jgi:hypothetical protein
MKLVSLYFLQSKQEKGFVLLSARMKTIGGNICPSEALVTLS